MDNTTPERTHPEEAPSAHEVTPFLRLMETAEQIGQCVAGPAAADVDRAGRFPGEALEALRAADLLGAGVPAEYGGGGCTVTQIAALCECLGKHCAATAMIFAMHQIQVATLVFHGTSSEYFRQSLRELVRDQRLLASVTSEVGVGGDMRSSLAAVQADGGGRFTLEKAATTISYGAHADALLVTARRTADSPPNDQALVLLAREDYTLEQTGVWDTLGMRGTCSHGFHLRGGGHVRQILPGTFADIAAQTMVPCSHIFWAAAWTGIAKAAVAKARAFVRAEARRSPGVVPPGAVHLAEVLGRLQVMEQSGRASAGEYERLLEAPEKEEVLSSIGYALRLNNLKVSASQLVAEIVTRSLGICGMSGYKNDSPYSLGRHLRDAHSAALMISNDRILANNASLLLVHKAD